VRDVGGPDAPAAAVLHFAETLERLAPVIKTTDDWAPLTNFVATDEFQRVGTFLEVQNWEQYLAMLTQWASTIEKFETTVHRISELPGLVYFEIEERHHRGDNVGIVNSMTVVAFNDEGKIRHLDVYLQQRR
jgi:hypothetical protein